MKPKRQLEVGMKVEFELVNSYSDTNPVCVGRVLELRGKSIKVGLGIEPKLCDTWITRRQITKVWVKKPKRVAREVFINEYNGRLDEAHHKSQDHAIYHMVNDEGVIIRFREVLE